ncbi:DUF5685 family protein [Aeoliella mucimassa]|uniref:NfeD-like C-terminal domain-containing protein n=1 Tax=Aeoliella mucimassa TaxID=2527972 RepID=A0A518ARB1_9BACT|nr:DUF5685 family protein [Aeoliella mucimassa]QDU57258.1 hypothetical protein Pan181_34730 [Aeoliella mucimassa]
MFGFMRGNRSDTTYRQVYAACCQAQRRHFGLTSLFFHSYEAIFLYLLAIDAQACDSPPDTAVTCCRLRNRLDSWPGFDVERARFGNAFALILAATKLDDDVRDDRSLVARLLRWRLRRPIAESRDYFSHLDPQFEHVVADFIAQHLRLERTADEPLSIEDYCAPTANAFGYFFQLFAEQLAADSTVRDAVQQIGSSIGAAILSFDCAVDYARDRQRGSFNPLANTRDVQRALDYSLHCLAEAGWRCTQTFGPAAATGRVVRAVFDRVAHRQAALLAPPSIKKRKRRGLLTTYRAYRRGFCVCDCGGCDGPGCDGGCDGGCCDAPGGDALGGDASNIDCLICVDCCGGCNPGDLRDSKRKNSPTMPLESNSPSSPSPMVGMTAFTFGPLNPSGYISLGGKTVPARSRGEWIGDDTEVQVIAEDSFGLIVKRLESRTSGG